MLLLQVAAPGQNGQGVLKQKTFFSTYCQFRGWRKYQWWCLTVCRKSLVLEQSRAQGSLYIFYCLLASLFFPSLQFYQKFLTKLALELFENDLSFKDSHMVISCTLRQAQSRISALALIDSEVSAYAFIDKFFVQHHSLPLHSLTYPHCLWGFNGQTAWTEDITHVTETTMTLGDHIKRLFLYVTGLNQYLIILSLPWLRCHGIDASFEFNTLTMFLFFCLAHCCPTPVTIHGVTWEEEDFLSPKESQCIWEHKDQEILLSVNQTILSHPVSASQKPSSIQSTLKEKLSVTLTLSADNVDPSHSAVHKGQYSNQAAQEKQVSHSAVHKGQLSIQDAQKEPSAHKKQFSIQTAQEKRPSHPAVHKE